MTQTLTVNIMTD